MPVPAPPTVAVPMPGQTPAVFMQSRMQFVSKAGHLESRIGERIRLSKYTAVYANSSTSLPNRSPAVFMQSRMQSVTKADHLEFRIGEPSVLENTQNKARPSCFNASASGSRPPAVLTPMPASPPNCSCPHDKPHRNSSRLHSIANATGLE